MDFQTEGLLLQELELELGKQQRRKKPLLPVRDASGVCHCFPLVAAKGQKDRMSFQKLGHHFITPCTNTDALYQNQNCSELLLDSSALVLLDQMGK